METFLAILELLVPVLVALITVIVPILFHKVKTEAAEKVAAAEAKHAATLKVVIQLARDNKTLLEIEAEHCENNKLMLNKSRKQTVRDDVANIKGARLSFNCQPRKLDYLLKETRSELEMLEAKGVSFDKRYLQDLYRHYALAPRS